MSRYLKDEQYERLLHKIEVSIPNHDSFQSIDCTMIGGKHVSSNIGLCNEGFTEQDTALFPKDFQEGYTSMKYRKTHHLCPFDKRVEKIAKGKRVNFGSGCYYTCSLQNATTDKEKLLSLVTLTKELHAKGDFKKAVNSYY